MTNGLSSHPETFAKSLPGPSAPVASGTPMIVIGFDGSIMDVSATASNLVYGTRNKTSNLNFFSLVHKSHLYPVMRDVADIVCRWACSETIVH